jgi:hypothetical protein
MCNLINLSLLWKEIHGNYPFQLSVNKNKQCCGARAASKCINSWIILNTVKCTGIIAQDAGAWSGARAV